MSKSSILLSYFALFLTQKSYVASLAKNAKVTLITFDVDGTLIQGSSSAAETASHAKAFSFGVGSVFASENLEEFRLKFPNPLSAVEKQNYHGSTDGLIALHFAKNACGVSSEDAFPKLNQVFEKMFEFMSPMTDSETCRGIEVLPGVIGTLEALVQHENFENNVICGLVTGNVEGIARKKMRACGILATNVLSRSSVDQQKWNGEEDSSFLGGFGSDFCSGDIADTTRIYKDRGEQIAIAFARAKSLLQDGQEIVRVVHCGDAPGDVLAAKYCMEEKKFGENVCVSCVAVATGRFTAEHLSSLFGESVTGEWEPVVLEKGIADPSFIEVCKIVN